MLSGYVIGLTNTAKISRNAAVRYFIRRGIRLIPIYWLAVLFSALLLPDYNLKTILGNLLFSQILLVPVLPSNSILWTLNYEVIYYLVFPLVWWLRPRVIILLLGSFAISTVGWFVPQLLQLLSSYSAGWIFWLIGLGLVWKVNPAPSNSTRIPLLSYLLLLIATNNLSTGVIILNGIGFPNLVAGAVNLSDMALLPICVLIFSEITHRRFWGYKGLRLVCLAIPVTNVLLLLFIGRLFENGSWIVSAIFTVLAIMFWRFRSPTTLLARLAPIGRISYAFYILHMPMMKLVHDYFPYQGTIWSFFLRLMAWFFLTIGASIVLELVMQPAIKRQFDQKFILKKL